MTIIRAEQALTVHGVESRAFAVIAAADGRIVNQKIKATRYYREEGHDYRITVELRFDARGRFRMAEGGGMIQLDNAGAEGGTLPDMKSDRSSMRPHSLWPVFAVWVLLAAVVAALLLAT